MLWETDTFHERVRFLKLPGYSKACQLTGTVFRLLLLAESTKPPNETEISFLSTLWNMEYYHYQKVKQNIIIQIINRNISLSKH